MLILSILLFGLIYPYSCSEMNTYDFKGMIGGMVEFELEEPDDLRTSGEGKFITINPNDDDTYPSFINHADLSRCSKTLYLDFLNPQCLEHGHFLQEIQLLIL